MRSESKPQKTDERVIKFGRMKSVFRRSNRVGLRISASRRQSRVTPIWRGAQGPGPGKLTRRAVRGARERGREGVLESATWEGPCLSGAGEARDASCGGAHGAHLEHPFAASEP